MGLQLGLSLLRLGGGLLRLGGGLLRLGGGLLRLGGGLLNVGLGWGLGMQHKTGLSCILRGSLRVRVGHRITVGLRLYMSLNTQSYLCFGGITGFVL